MSFKSFATWLALKEDLGTPDTGAQPLEAPDVNMANQAVKAKMGNVNPAKPLAHQARKVLATVAAGAKNPMAVAQLDAPTPDPANPAKGAVTQ